MTTAHDFQAKTIDGKDASLAGYQGKALLVVNVASKCGLTPQYEGLQKVYLEYQERGLEVLGFPCNQFMGQEPGTEAEIQSFCQSKYDVTFPLFSKIDVNGPAAHPLYQWLRSETGNGDITWNFEKFVIAPDGTIKGRFSPKTAPDDPKLLAAIESALES